MTVTAIHIEGNLIAPDMTPEISAGEIKGQTSVDFGLEKLVKLEDEIAFAWGEAKDQWRIFQRRLERIGETDTATSETREYWAIPLLKLLGYEPVYQAKAELIDGQTFAISHRSNPDYKPIVDININQDHPQSETQNQDIHPYPPIHIIGCRLSLEQRPPSGMRRLSGHGLLQEYLNKTEHLWGIVTNGLRWRLLRDCSLMTRLTYVEFDLEQIINGENFADFSLFYRLFHRSRLPESIEDVDSCLLEFYHQEALQQGGRVRDRLRDGVEEALKLLGNGFLQHPSNEELRQKVRSCALAPKSEAEAQQQALTEGEFYRQLLLLIYRLLFLMVAESRNLLLSGEDEEKARIYNEYYSIFRLRILAERPSYRREGFQDIWQGLRVTFSLFDESWRGELLGLSPLNGDLFGSESLAILDNCAIDNHDLLLAIRNLSLYQNKGTLRRVNYTALDVEELGSVYESLLDFTPRVTVRDGIYYFRLVAGSDRKTTGSYYTPPELVGQLIKSALEPVIEAKVRSCALAPKSEAEAQQKALEEALLSLKVCDPACGSGHFLLAAARRIGKELARIRTGEVQPTPEVLRIAIRDVIQNCIYGVDLNPLAVDLCKVALWIEGFCQGFPLNFLDHRIKCGNALVGVLDISVLDEGIPDEAFKPVTGDDKKWAGSLKKRNKQEKEDIEGGQLSLFDSLEADRSEYAVTWRELGNIPETNTDEVKRKQQQYQSSHSEENQGWWRDYSACNLWTAAFFMALTEQNLQLLPTSAALHRLLKAQDNLGLNLNDKHEVSSSASALTNLGLKTTNEQSITRLVEAANRLAQEKRFFHWCLEFPDVFDLTPQPPLLKGEGEDVFDLTSQPRLLEGEGEKISFSFPLFPSSSGRGVRGEGKQGFDCVLGNPPWERIKLQEKEFFASKDESIANAKNKAARTRLIKQLAQDNPALLLAFEEAKHEAEAQSKFIRESGRFPLTAVGDINTYAIFAETVRKLINSEGRVGVIVPTGIATDNTTKDFFGDLIKTQNLASLYDFENRERLFPEVDSRMKFALLVLTKHITQETRFSFFLTQAKQLDNQKRVFTLSAQDIQLINPNTLTCPVFRTKADADLTKKIYQHHEILLSDSQKYSHTVRITRMFDMNKQDNLFESLEDISKRGIKDISGYYYINKTKYLPLVDGKSFDAYDHRYATQKVNQNAQIRTSIAEPITIEEHQDINFVPNKLLYINEKLVEQWSNGRLNRKWIIGLMNVTSSTNHRTVIASLLPDVATDYSVRIVIFDKPDAIYSACLLGLFNSLTFDYIARQKLQGLNLSDYITYQLAVPSKEKLLINQDFIVPRILELVYTAYDMKPFAEDMGYDGEPFIWDEQRRAILRAELDAKYAKLYGLTRDELRYILDPADIYGEDFPSETFRVLKNNEMKKYGEYRTQRLVLAAWDMMG